MIPRLAQKAVETALARSPVTALLGPRQCGKTTLARMLAKDRAATYFDLESEPDRARLQNPEFALRALSGLIVIDEIQRRPDLFEVLRVVADDPGRERAFLVLGSASPRLVKGASETLAGRVEFVDLGGFDLDEVGAEQATPLWVRGGFPRSFLAASEADSLAWREGFIRTFLERDIPQLGVTTPAPVMRRFWTMLAHFNGGTWNASAVSRSLGVDDKTVRGYLDVLAGTYMVRLLQPWYENLRKRQVRAPKIYLRDTGVLHSLLSIGSHDALLGHPGVGASWEAFALEHVFQALRPTDAYFWGTHQGAELDLMFMRSGRRYGIEFKFAGAPRTTRSMRVAIEDLGLARLFVIYPGEKRYPVDERIEVVPLAEVQGLADTDIENMEAASGFEPGNDATT